MNCLYNFAIASYVAALRVAALCGHRKARLMEQGRKGWAERMRAARRPEDRYVWFHAASLGEFEQGRPLMEQLREQHPEYRILLTFFSPSGYEVRRDYRGADIVSYLPYDRRGAMRQFLDIARPEKAFFVKYEFWGNCLEELSRRRVPTYLVSGIFRRRQVFFKWYGGMMRRVLGCFDHLFVQDEESLTLLGGIDIQNVTIAGDTRFDRVLAIARAAKTLPWAERFAASAPFTLVAGSTWPKDEEILIAHFNARQGMKLIIAPHEIHEEHIQSIIAKLHRPWMRYTELDEERVASVDCLIIDAIGFLSSIYRYGQMAYIGGGFGVGIHNTLEAAVYGIPVLFGPNHEAFREATGLIGAGGAFPIADAATYAAVADRLVGDAAATADAGAKAKTYVRENAGAADTIFAAVFG